MEARLRQFVRRRAKNYCEYCGLSQNSEPLSFHIEHIISRKHGGKDSEENLALVITAACIKEQIYQDLIQKQKS